MLIGYARVSSTHKNPSLDAQREELIEAGCNPDNFFSDTIVGANWQRPGLAEALQSMRGGDTLVVTGFDALGRNVVETVTTITDLVNRGFSLRVLEPSVDTSDASDNAVFTVMASLAEWQHKLRSVRIREGVARARAEGRVAGPKPKLSPAQKEQVFELVEAGKPIASVARMFSVSRQTIYRAVKSLENAA